MTLSHYEERLNDILKNRLPAQVEIDEHGATMLAHEYRAEQLTLLSQEIRRCVWGNAVKGDAHQLAQLADLWAAKLLRREHTQPAPRFETLVSNGIVHRAIQ